MLKLRSLEFRSFDVPLKEPFGIASGKQEVAENVLVFLELDTGPHGAVVGLGEAAPFPAASGETQSGTLRALGEVEVALRQLDMTQTHLVAAALREVIPDAPAARAGVEIALFDALARFAGKSLFEVFGGKTHRLRTDITIVTGSPERASTAAREAAALGFDCLKVKVGGSTLDDDHDRLVAVLEAAPRANLVLDANAAFSPQEALALLRALGSQKDRVHLFEQPVAASDLDGLAEVERDGGVVVAADESLRSEADFERIVRHGGISAINLKTAKLGVHLARDLLVRAKERGLLVMVGGMVETEISMTTSACLVGGHGGVEFVDLDTPLFLGERPLEGGFVQRGPDIDLSRIEQGHGVTLVPFEPSES